MEHEANYHPDWGENGTIHLDGEMDFGAETPLEDVYESLWDRAEMIGEIVTKESETHVKVTGQRGMLAYHLYAESPEEPVNRIKSVNRRKDEEVEKPVSEIKEEGREAQEFIDFLEEQAEKGNLSVEVGEST